MDSSAQLKVACFIFVNHTRNAFFSRMCCLCLFFLENWVLEKIHSKFVKPWEMKNLLWDCEKGVKRYDTRWSRESWKVWCLCVWLSIWLLQTKINWKVTVVSIKKKIKQIISFCLFKRVFLPIFGKQCLYFLMWASECRVGVDGAINSRSWSLHSHFIF